MYDAQQSQDSVQGAGDAPGEGIAKRSLIFLFVTVLLSTTGIGLIAPIEPFLVQRYVSSPATLAVAVGWLSAAYALCSFISAPGLGALSDRFGRRPILLISLLGSAIGYLIFGLGGALWVLFFARIIDGMTAGNVSTIFAYLGDTTRPQDRGRYFGMLGATLGTGFIIGPVIGGLLATFGYQAPLYFAAGLTILNLLWGIFYLPESLAPANRTASISVLQLNPLTQLQQAFALPKLRWLLIAAFLFVCPFAAFQATLAVLCKNLLNWNAGAIGGLFFLVGVVGIAIQGGLLQKLQPIFGDGKLAISGLAIEIVGYLVLSMLGVWRVPATVIVGTAIFAVGDGLIMPSVGGLLSRAADAREQGRAQGANESVQSLAQVTGPFLGGQTYASFGPAFPYRLGAVFVALAIGALMLALPFIPKTADQPAWSESMAPER